MATANESALGEQPRPLIVSRIFPVPREFVYRAWSSAGHVTRWFCPAGYTVPQAEVEFRVGGAFNICMRSPDAKDHWTRGKFVELVPTPDWCLT